MVSRRFLQKIKTIRKWLFQLLDMVATDVETDPKISLEKVSEKVHYRVRNYKENSEAHLR